MTKTVVTELLDSGYVGNIAPQLGLPGLEMGGSGYLTLRMEGMKFTVVASRRPSPSLIHWRNNGEFESAASPG